MPSPSPRDPSTGRKRRKVIRADTGFPVQVVADPLLILSTDPDDLDALKREPGGQTSTPVPVVGLARGDVTELHTLDGTDGVPTSRQSP